MDTEGSPLTVILTGVSLLLVSGALTYWFLAQRRASKGTFVDKIQNIPKGTLKEVSVDDRKVLLAHTADGKVLAVGPKCSHFGAPLAKGVLVGDRIVCPWHGACFNACSGDIEDGPVLDAISSFPVTCSSNGGIYVKLPPPSVQTSQKRPPRLSKRVGSDARHFVIIGCGAAAAAAIETLRAEGFTGAITVVSKEATLPYDRTKLSKNMAYDDPKELQLRSAEFYAQADVRMLLGVTVTAVRSLEREVVLDTGDVLRYTALLCASGGPPRTFRKDRNEGFSIEGADLSNVFPLREISHSMSIEAAVASGGPVQNIVVMGSSFIGMESAAYLAQMKKCTNITVIGMESEPFERVLGPKIGAFMRHLHESKGVRFRMGAVVSKFVPVPGTGRVGAVIVKNAKTGEITEMPADLVIVGGGIVPALEYLKNTTGVSLLEKAPGGVRADECLKVADGIHAAGDIVYFPYSFATDATHAFTRIEHWNVAMDQGRCAARNMLGLKAKYENVPFFYTSQYGKSLRMAGHALKVDDVIIHGSLAHGLASEFTAYFVQGDAVAAVATYNRDPEGAAASELLRLKMMPSKMEMEGLPALDLCKYLAERCKNA